MESNHHPLPTVPQTARVAVLYGGRSSERAVSLRSGANCLAALHRLGYANAFLLDAASDVAQQLVERGVEVAFLALHGEYGEDGRIQGLLEYLGIPYTGNRLAASAVTMNKDLTKRLLREAGLPVLPSLVLELARDRMGACRKPDGALLDQVEAELGSYPFFVKPLGGGSSVGMAKVHTRCELAEGLQTAWAVEPRAMVEPFVAGRDLTVGIIQVDGQPTVTPILEIRPKTGWYDYEAKYTPGMTDFLLPAPLPAEVTEAIQRATLDTHRALGCHGVSRTDFVLADNLSAFYILEVNSIPGMTDTSDLPAQCAAMGIQYDQLVYYILQTAVQIPAWMALATSETTDRVPHHPHQPTVVLDSEMVHTSPAPTASTSAVPA